MWTSFFTYNSVITSTVPDMTSQKLQWRFVVHVGDLGETLNTFSTRDLPIASVFCSQSDHFLRLTSLPSCKGWVPVCHPYFRKFTLYLVPNTETNPRRSSFGTLFLNLRSLNESPPGSFVFIEPFTFPSVGYLLRSRLINGDTRWPRIRPTL